MYTHREVRPYIGSHVQCHTHFGTFQGVIVQCTKQHLILMPVAQPAAHGLNYGSGMDMDPDRPWGMGGGPMGGGPGGPMGGGPGGPMGPGGGPAGPGGGWHFAIPLAAILGITAVGMHWW